MKVITIIIIILIMLGYAGLLNNIVEQLKQANNMLAILINRVGGIENLTIIMEKHMSNRDNRRNGRDN